MTKQKRIMNQALRRRIAHWWDEYEWPVVGALGFVTVLLGYIGFSQYAADSGMDRSRWDIFYWTLQLFVLESGSLPERVPWELQIARLMAPTLLAYTAIQALLVIFRQQLQLLRAHLLKGHIVICGLGQKGLLLAKAFREQNYPVVVIEADKDNPYLSQCYQCGAIALIGNAMDPLLLYEAHAHKAKYLIAVCADDGANAEVVVHARELVQKKSYGRLECFVHISDQDLAHLLKEKEISGQNASALQLEFFNVDERGAKALLNLYPAFPDDPQKLISQAHIIVIGLGSFGENVVVEAAKRWYLTHQSKGRLTITVLDKEASVKKASLEARYPQLSSACDIQAWNIDLESAEFQRANFLFDPEEKCKITAIYLCLNNDPKNLSSALKLRQRLREYQVLIVVRMTQQSGLASLLTDEADNKEKAFNTINAFVLLERTCTPDLLLGGTLEVLARAIHEDYVRIQREMGQTRQTNPSMAPWNELPEFLKESNRDQASHIGAKLDAVGCAITPAANWVDTLHKFSDEEIEKLAEMEHERWIRERKSAGWTQSPTSEKDISKKQTPYLVPYDELTDQIKEYDRNTIRNLPLFLAKAGFEIYRKAGPK